jgi:hypothetical protein
MAMTDGSFTELAIGEQGEHVTELQERLRDLGHEVPDTGVFDEQTQLVLTEFATSHGVTDGSTATAVAQLQTETGELKSTEWEAHYTAPVGKRYEGENQPGNTVWANEERKQTYVPPDAGAARSEFGYDITGGKVGSGDELLDTTGIGTTARFKGSKPERMIFTMDTEGDLNLADSRAEEDARPGMRVHHSTLGGGVEVAGAGEMKIREGVVEQVSDTSGHYRPDFAMTQQVGGALKNQGVDTDKVTFELGNYGPNDERKKDTLVSGTELLSYDREATLGEINVILRKNVDVAGRQKWSGAWDMLPPDVRQKEEGDLFAQLAQPYGAMSDRDLQQEARKILQGRHEKLDSVLAQIKLGRGWRDDPTGKHSLRFYDGTSWTARVLNGDTESQDQEGLLLLGGGGGGGQAPSQAPQQASQAPGSNEAPQGGGGGGYLPDPTNAQAPGGGGGYLPDPTNTQAQGGGGGGYLPDPTNTQPQGGVGPSQAPPLVSPAPGGQPPQGLDPDGGYID